MNAENAQDVQHLAQLDCRLAALERVDEADGASGKVREFVLPQAQLVAARRDDSGQRAVLIYTLL
ncbi:hypothetical protein EV380_1596 [Zhihengliuella halotolerans]|uniref:Uncharacterized protein n=1 Tax=Zhihengliuella halotolerans TaxID=370736 RepID=A0A4Q8ACS5_9MICC|nr:hypothetical protein EV380_1596 [Zhihengliuella halotolerans]